MKKLVCIFLLLPLFASRGASFRMFTGDIFDGRPDFNPDGITVTPDHGGNPNKIDIANLQDAIFVQQQDSAGMLPAGVFLTNGSFIAGAATAADGQTIISAHAKFGHGGHGYHKPIAGTPTAFNEPSVTVGAAKVSVPGTAIAIVLFAPIQKKSLPAASDRTGAILPNGDFIEGSVDGMIEGRLQINSLLFGAQQLVAGNQVAGAVLCPFQNAAGNYEVVTKDGSRYLATDLKMDHDGLSFTDTIVGNIKVKPEDLVEIRAAAWRYQSLAETTPARVQAPVGVDPATAFKAQTSGPTLEDSVPVILSSANTMVSYVVPPGFSVFVSSVTLPKDAPATAHMTFDVYADGRLVYGSPIVAAGANPQPVRVNMGATRLITLRAEPSGPGANGAIGRWVYPILLRP